MAEQPTEPAANYYVTRRHYSLNLAPAVGAGRRGTALCRPGGQPTDVYDQEWVTREDQRYRRGKPPRQIADLPECKACARALAKLNTTQPGQ
ncbi:hypothetical protein [Verrucosispora sp. NA02020]|uniref:hypothetical protein n=1 Tax=Verrucosispora sp. NA02020 TaxID=2742132 RepID=UPI00158FE14E|nr:hypothetical protein [Verrucosispora sp. NA02020]QKW15425.1 hypothetical protein HUT12_23435 [Verrucosispora sp. NA02020]